MTSDSEKQLLQLCTNGNLPSLKDFTTKEQLNLTEVKDSSGLTPLHIACQHGHLDIAQYLIKDQNCSPETTTPNGRTPLHIACKSGHLHIVKCLITDHKCNPHCTDNDGYTPLHAASESGNIETVKYLITEQGCDPQVSDSIGVTPLHYASESGHLDILQCLIEGFKCDPNKSSNKGSIPLQYACKGGQIAVARYLIEEHQCSPNCTNMFGNTTLHFACLTGCLPLVEYLTELGCNPQTVNKDGSTPLHYTCANGHLDVLKYLISVCNCNPECVTNSGFVPLHCACENGHLEVAKYLITKHKCNPEYGNVNGYTPLHSAASNGHLAVVKYLISQLGCDPQITDNDGLTPLHFACLNGHLDITKYLISNCNCNPQCSIKNGNTPLHCACKKGHLEVAKYLITEHKCSPEHGNVSGFTPLLSADCTFESAMSTTSKKYSILLHIWHIIMFSVTVLAQVFSKFISENFNRKSTSHDITADALSAIHEGRSSVQQHANFDQQYLDIVNYLITEHNCNPQCRDKEGQTPLHYACASGQLEIVQYFHKEKLSDLVHKAHSGDTPLHFACKYNQVEVVQFLLSTGECDPLIKNIEGITPVEIAPSPKISALLDHFCKGCYPLESVVKVFVLGDSFAGKSSLVQAIQSNPGFLGSLIGRFQKVKGVRQQTAGIDLFSFSSSDFGNVVIYDFAGQREFFTSHTAFLQISSSCVPGVFILVVNIADHEDIICQSVQYWVSFIQECCAHSNTKPCIIIIGSHADQLDKGAVEEALTIICNCFSENSTSRNENEAVICLDCTRPSSPGLDLLRFHLEESCNFIRKGTEKIDQRCYVLHKYIHKEYINMGIHGSELKNISKDLEDDPYLLPSNSTELLPLFQTLHDKGQVILLRNKHILDNSWIITNIAAMLETVVGSIFAPRDFPQHIPSGSTGIVPKSRISEAFPDLNIDMVIGFLEHFEFCHQVGVDWVRIIQSRHEESDDEFYLFPALVTAEDIPKHVLQGSHEGNYCCGWCMYSTAEHQFFTARFLHVLLLRLAFLFALPQDDAIPTAGEDETPVLKRSCRMWKSGITWHDTHGIQTHFEVTNLNTVILIMSCMKGREVHCVKLRTQLISAILKARKEFCPRVDVEECIMEVGNDRVAETERCPSQCTKYSLKYISDRISTRDAKDHQDLLLVNPDGSPGTQISELLYFEPFTLLTSDLITKMFSEENSTLILSDIFLSELAGRLYPYNNILALVLMPQPKLLNEKLKMDVYSLDRLDEMSKQLRCVHILEAWMEQQDSPATYKRLRKKLNKYSIYCGRNPLDLVCKTYLNYVRSYTFN